MVQAIEQKKEKVPGKTDTPEHGMADGGNNIVVGSGYLRHREGMLLPDPFEWVAGKCQVYNQNKLVIVL